MNIEKIIDKINNGEKIVMTYKQLVKLMIDCEKYNYRCSIHIDGHDKNENLCILTKSR